MNNQQTKKQKPYDLEERTLIFSKEIIFLCQKLQKDPINNRLISQLVASASSVGANYREANEAVSKKDFVHRLRIARKECKETTYWLDLLKETDSKHKDEFINFIDESKELRNILTAIINKTE